MTRMQRHTPSQWRPPWSAEAYKKESTHSEAKNGLWIMCANHVQSSAGKTQPGI